MFVIWPGLVERAAHRPVHHSTDQASPNGVALEVMWHKHLSGCADVKVLLSLCHVRVPQDQHMHGGCRAVVCTAVWRVPAKQPHAQLVPAPIPLSECRCCSCCCCGWCAGSLLLAGRSICGKPQVSACGTFKASTTGGGRCAAVQTSTHSLPSAVADQHDLST